MNLNFSDSEISNGFWKFPTPEDRKPPNRWLFSCPKLQAGQHRGEPMQHSDQPYRELERAKQSVAGIREAETLTDVEEHWKDYLHRIERVWNKAVNHFGRSPKWNGWQGRFLKLRKSDPLLSYLINARGADEHTIADITQFDPGHLSFQPDENGVVHIEQLQIKKNKVVRAEFGAGSVEFTPARLRLLPVQNRGVTYGVPELHLSKPVSNADPVEIAELGIAFYADFLDAAERFFIAPARETS